MLYLSPAERDPRLFYVSRPCEGERIFVRDVGSYERFDLEGISSRNICPEEEL